MATKTDVKAAQTAAFSDGAVSVAPGDSLFLFTDDAAGLRPTDSVSFYADTTDNDLPVFTLNGDRNLQAVCGYANLIAKKAVTGVKVGVGKFSS